MLRRSVAGLVALFVLATCLLSATPAAAEGSLWCDEENRCYVELQSLPRDPAPSPDENGWTAGAPVCYYEDFKQNLLGNGWAESDLRVFNGGGSQRWYVEISCGSDFSYWSNNRQCYIGMVDDASWPARPVWYSPDAAYYRCSNEVGGSLTFLTFWSEAVPPGLKVLTPGKAAEKLISTFQLQGIEIGMAPKVNPAWGHRRSYVGVPIWLWVDNPQPLSWGPYTETATLGGQTITATAQVSTLQWDMGDGASLLCATTGTPYTVGYGVTNSPTCGHQYSQTSSSNAGDRYTVTATSQWVVTWTSLSGATGTVNLTTSSSTQLEINELQTVNVSTVTPEG